jgi:hypothetical protein
MSATPTPLPTRPTTPAALDPRSITSPEQITAQLALLAKREAELSAALNALVSDRSSIENAISHLQDLGEDIHALSLDVDRVGPSTALGLQNGHAPDELNFGDEGGLVERVRRVWETSERVGGKVRRLDEEVGRVREATDIVTEVLELKVSCSSTFGRLTPERAAELDLGYRKERLGKRRESLQKSYGYSEGCHTGWIRWDRRGQLDVFCELVRPS